MRTGTLLEHSIAALKKGETLNGLDTVLRLEQQKLKKRSTTNHRRNYLGRTCSANLPVLPGGVTGVLFPVGSGSYPQAATVRHASVVVAMSTRKAAVAGLTGVQIFLTAAGTGAPGGVGMAVPAKFMRFAHAGAANREPSVSDGGFGW